jgi:hypothetical protein
MSVRVVRSALAAGALLATMWLVPAPVTAAGEAPRLGLTPMGQTGPYFDLTMVPGENRQVEVEAANFGSERTRARTYAADVYSIVNGGFGARLYGEPTTATTAWLDYPTQRMTLEPQQALQVPFVVSVPIGTPPGEYITALVIESTDPLQSSGPLALNQVNRSAIAVAIDVPGPRDARLSIGLVRHKTVGGHSILSFEVQNPGNVHLWPAGRFQLLDGRGSRIVAAAVVMDALYAGTRTRLEAPLSDALPPGDYCAELSLTDSATGAHDATECLAFSVGPPSNDGAGGDSPGPTLLPGTSTGLAAASVSLSIIVGAALIGWALLLAARRRRPRLKAVRGPGGQSVKPAAGSHRVSW